MQYKQAVAVHLVRDQVRQLWPLKTLRGVAQLSAHATMPPFGHCPRTTVTPLRIRLRGGLWAFLRWHSYNALHRSGDLCDVCPFCGGDLTIPHAVADCVRFEKARVEHWKCAWMVARQQPEPLMPDEVNPELLVPGEGGQCRQWWYLLTIGEEVPDAFLNIGVEGWASRRGKPDPELEGPNRFRRRLPVYTRLLGITGRLLYEVEQALTLHAQAQPQTAGAGPAAPLPQAAAVASAVSDGGQDELTGAAATAAPETTAP